MLRDEPAELADQELVRRMRRGRDHAAESALCRRFAARIRLYGLRHLRDEERARELVQIVLLGVIEACRAGRVEEADKLDRYILGTCRNAAARMRETDARAVPAGDQVDRLATVEAALDAGAEVIDRRTLARCLSGLDARAVRVVLLSFQEERSADEIAGMLAMEPGHVRVVRHRALAALRRCFDSGARP